MNRIAKTRQPGSVVPIAFAVVFLFTAKVFSAPEPAVAGPVLSFGEFSQKVLRYYPKLKQQDVNVSAAIARKLQAVSGFLPSAQLSASVSHGDDPVYVFGSLLREDAFTQDNFALSKLNTPGAQTSYNLTLNAQVPIFDAMQTISRVRSAKLHVSSAEYEKEFTKMEAFLLATEAYMRAVSLDKLLSTVQEVSQASEEDVKQAQDLKTQGLILGADFYTAKVALGNIDQLKNQLIQEKKAAHILLNILMGEDPFNTFEVRGNIDGTTQENRALQDWFDSALKSRPDLAAVDKVIEAQGVEVSREKATALPRLDAFGEAREDTRNFSSDGGQNYIVGAKATIDLFDPSYSSRVKISKENLKKAKLDQAMLKDTIVRDVTNEYAHFQTVQDNLPLTHDMLEDAQQAVDLTLPLYREGRKSIADLLAIRWAYLNTARNFYTQAADSTVSWTRLLFLSGQLDESSINEVEKKLSE